MPRPTKIKVGDPEARRYRLVRLDTFADVPGDLLWADEATGAYAVPRTASSEVVEHTIPAGIRIVPKRR